MTELNKKQRITEFSKKKIFNFPNTLHDRNSEYINELLKIFNNNDYERNCIKTDFLISLLSGFYTEEDLIFILNKYTKFSTDNNNIKYINDNFNLGISINFIHCINIPKTLEPLFVKFFLINSKNETFYKSNLIICVLDN